MCPGVLRDIAPALSRDQILVSVIAGFPLSLLCEPLPEHAKVIRSMPNTPMLVGQGKFRNGFAIVLIDANFFKPLSIKIRQKFKFVQRTFHVEFWLMIMYPKCLQKICKTC